MIDISKYLVTDRLDDFGKVKVLRSFIFYKISDSNYIFMGKYPLFNMRNLLKYCTYTSYYFQKNYSYSVTRHVCNELSNYETTRGLAGLDMLGYLNVNAFPQDKDIISNFSKSVRKSVFTYIPCSYAFRKRKV